jgi:hypothetical protein
METRKNYLEMIDMCSISYSVKFAVLMCKAGGRSISEGTLPIFASKTPEILRTAGNRVTSITNLQR